MKYIANPFLFETNPGAFVETNVTALTFYDTSGLHLNISLDSSTNYIQISEPY